MAIGLLGLRRCDPGDAAELAAMYSMERDALELTDPSFFESDGQRDRITCVWAEFRTAGYVVLDFSDHGSLTIDGVRYRRWILDRA